MYEITSCLSWVSTNLWYPCASLFQLGEPHKGHLLCSARILSACQKYSIFNYKTLLLGFLFFLRHKTEWVMCKNPAPAAAERFPKQPGRSMTREDRQIPGAAGCQRHLCDKAACKEQNSRAKNPPDAALWHLCGMSPSCHRPLGKASLEGEKCKQ